MFLMSLAASSLRGGKKRLFAKTGLYKLCGCLYNKGDL